MNTKQMLNELRRGKNAAANISGYADKYTETAYQYAMHRMALQYYTLYETVQEYHDNNKEAEDILERLHECVSSMLKEDGSLTTEKVGSLRSEIIGRMRVLTAYTDILQIYEYVLNRVEPKFNSELKDFPDLGIFLNRLNTYIYAVKDNVVINERIKDVIGQLPVRMTKSKFYEYVSNSFDLYKKADEEALESFVYMLRSCSMLDKPEGMDRYFASYRELAESLSKVEYDKLTKEEYDAVSDRLAAAAEEIRGIIDLYLSIQEIVNDLYIVSLTFGNISEKKSNIIATLKEILSRLNSMFLDGADGEIPDDLTGRLAITEGHQESLLAECHLLEASYDEMVSTHQETIASEGKQEIFDTFPQIARLMSSSVFAELTDSALSAPVTAESLSKAKETMLSEYAELFGQNTKLVNRAVMAASLNKMPVVFNTAQELTDYIQQSLLQCRDEYERKAALNILDSIMLEG
jgi:hypothetical protein